MVNFYFVIRSDIMIQLGHFSPGGLSLCLSSIYSVMSCPCPLEITLFSKLQCVFESISVHVLRDLAGFTYRGWILNSVLINWFHFIFSPQNAFAVFVTNFRINLFNLKRNATSIFLS